ncbi:MAG: sigma-E processing peptidase SpoIIGA [Oscillospiraceae bacterium]|nr:sigma-E processing peptidase SpoIIGA [Oscillospiraceae bacterium]
MEPYSGFVMVLIFCVDFLLLLGTNRLCGYPSRLWRCILGSGMGALHAGISILPGFGFLGNLFWRTVFIGMISCVAFGMDKTVLRRGMVLWLLHMALGGVSSGIGTNGIWSMVLAAMGICLLCLFGIKYGVGSEQYVPVELCYGDRRVKLTALHDTGNRLFDPVSGLPVLVVGADAAQTLTGLTKEQLRQPVESIGSIPGLRLIPYKTIGKENGFMLGLRLPQVQVGSRRSSCVVAFAPECLGTEGTYQALTGGAL